MGLEQTIQSYWRNKLGGAKESGINIGFGGAKFLVEELAGERKVLNFADAASANEFIKSN